jgi:hypothetical protein
MKVNFVFLMVSLIFFIGTSAFAVEEGLIGYWSFDEGKGDVAKDASGNNNDGKLVRGVKWVDGKFDKALQFDGTQRHKVEVPHSDSLATIADALTIEAWVNPANFNQWVSFGVKGDITYGMFINPAAYVRIHYSGGNTLDTPANAIKANEWTHVVGAYDGKKVRIYLNGKMAAEKNAGDKIPANNATFVIGGTQESRDWFTGMLDEVKLYNRGLTEVQVQKAFEGPPKSVALVGKLAVLWGRLKIQQE